MLFYILIFIAGSGALAEHGLYLSVTEIEVFEKELSITVKVFSDDLYSCMLNRDATIESSNDKFIKEEVEAYFAEYLDITGALERIEMKLESFSQEGDSYFLHFSSPLSNDSKQLKIRLGHFYELFPTQRNILKLKTPSAQHHRIFKAKDQVETISLKG